MWFLLRRYCFASLTIDLTIYDFCCSLGPLRCSLRLLSNSWTLKYTIDSYVSLVPKLPLHNMAQNWAILDRYFKSFFKYFLVIPHEPNRINGLRLKNIFSLVRKTIDYLWLTQDFHRYLWQLLRISILLMFILAILRICRYLLLFNRFTCTSCPLHCHSFCDS